MRFPVGCPTTQAPILTHPKESVVSIAYSPLHKVFCVLTQIHLQIWSGLEQTIQLASVRLPGCSLDSCTSMDSFGIAEGGGNNNNLRHTSCQAARSPGERSRMDESVRGNCDVALKVIWHPKGREVVVSTLDRRLLFYEIDVLIKCSSDAVGYTKELKSFYINNASSRVALSSQLSIDAGMFSSIVTTSKTLLIVTAGGSFVVIGWSERKVLHSLNTHQLLQATDVLVTSAPSISRNMTCDSIDSSVILRTRKATKIVRGTLIGVDYCRSSRVTVFIFSDGSVLCCSVIPFTSSLGDTSSVSLSSHRNGATVASNSLSLVSAGRFGIPAKTTEFHLIPSGHLRFICSDSCMTPGGQSVISAALNPYLDVLVTVSQDNVLSFYIINNEESTEISAIIGLSPSSHNQTTESHTAVSFPSLKLYHTSGPYWLDEETTELGPCVALDWSRDGTTLLVGFTFRGVTLFHYSGAAIGPPKVYGGVVKGVGGTAVSDPFTKNSSMERTNSLGRTGSNHSIDAGINVGCRIAVFGAADTRLIYVDLSGHTLVISSLGLVHSGGSYQSVMDSFGCLAQSQLTLLEGGGMQTLQMTDSIDSSNNWEAILAPKQYLEFNYPLRHCAASACGQYLAVAGEYGAAVYNRNLRRWRIFGSQKHEMDIKCVAPPLWLNSACLVLPIFHILTKSYRLQIYPIYDLDPRSLVTEIILERRPVILSCAPKAPEMESKMVLAVVDSGDRMTIVEVDICSKDPLIPKEIKGSVRMLLKEVNIRAARPSEISDRDPLESEPEHPDPNTRSLSSTVNYDITNLRKIRVIPIPHSCLPHLRWERSSPANSKNPLLPLIFALKRNHSLCVLDFNNLEDNEQRESTVNVRDTPPGTALVLQLSQQYTCFETPIVVNNYVTDFWVDLTTFISPHFNLFVNSSGPPSANGYDCSGIQILRISVDYFFEELVLHRRRFHQWVMTKGISSSGRVTITPPSFSLCPSSGVEVPGQRHTSYPKSLSMTSLKSSNIFSRYYNRRDSIYVISRCRLQHFDTEAVPLGILPKDGFIIYGSEGLIRELNFPGLPAWYQVSVKPVLFQHRLLIHLLMDQLMVSGTCGSFTASSDVSNTGNGLVSFHPVTLKDSFSEPLQVTSLGTGQSTTGPDSMKTSPGKVVANPATLALVNPREAQRSIRCILQRLQEAGTFAVTLEYALYHAIHEDLEEGNIVNSNVNFLNSSGYSSSLMRASIDRRNVIRSIIALIRKYPDYHTIVTKCVRKIDASKWRAVFDVIGSPVDFFRECCEAGKVVEAAHLVRVLLMDMSMVPHDALTTTIQCASELFGTTLGAKRNNGDSDGRASAAAMSVAALKADNLDIVSKPFFTSSNCTRHSNDDDRNGVLSLLSSVREGPVELGGHQHTVGSSQLIPPSPPLAGSSVGVEEISLAYELLRFLTLLTLEVDLPPAVPVQERKATSAIERALRNMFFNDRRDACNEKRHISSVSVKAVRGDDKSGMGDQNITPIQLLKSATAIFRNSKGGADDEALRKLRGVREAEEKIGPLLSEVDQEHVDAIHTMLDHRHLDLRLHVEKLAVCLFLNGKSLLLCTLFEVFSLDVTHFVRVMAPLIMGSGTEEERIRDGSHIYRYIESHITTEEYLSPNDPKIERGHLESTIGGRNRIYEHLLSTIFDNIHAEFSLPRANSVLSPFQSSKSSSALTNGKSTKNPDTIYKTSCEYLHSCQDFVADTKKAPPIILPTFKTITQEYLVELKSYREALEGLRQLYIHHHCTAYVIALDVVLGEFQHLVEELYRSTLLSHVNDPVVVVSDVVGQTQDDYSELKSHSSTFISLHSLKPSVWTNALVHVLRKPINAGYAPLLNALTQDNENSSIPHV